MVRNVFLRKQFLSGIFRPLKDAYSRDLLLCTEKEGCFDDFRREDWGARGESEVEISRFVGGEERWEAWMEGGLETAVKD